MKPITLPKFDPAKFRNRVVGHGTERVDSMMANPLNMRVHSLNQQSYLAKLVNLIGFAGSIKVSRNSGAILDGHARVAIALRTPEIKELPVEYLDLTPEEEALFLMFFDVIGGMAGLDPDKGAELTSELGDIKKEPETADLLLLMGKITGSKSGGDVTDEFAEYDQLDEQGQGSGPENVRLQVLVPEEHLAAVINFLDGEKERGVRWARK